MTLSFYEDKMINLAVKIAGYFGKFPWVNFCLQGKNFVK